jgi:hypothetical protein
MSSTARQSGRHLLFALIFAAAIVIPRAALIQLAHSPTSDDDYHLVRGLEFLQRDKGLVHRELNDPPLGEAIAALPLWLMGGTTHGRMEGTALYDQSAYSPETALMSIAIWKAVLFLPLIAVAFLWCGKLYGLPSAWLAVILLVVEPTLAGHLHLAALDVIATTGIVAACFFGWRYFERPTTGRLLTAATACAVALLLKHTGILVPPLLCVYGIIFHWRGRLALHRDDAKKPSSQEAKEGKGVVHSEARPAAATAFAFAEVLKAAFLTLLVIWLLLGFDLSPGWNQHSLPGGLYIKSILDAARHVAAPNDAFLNGQIHRGGWWYYFPAVAWYKIPIGIGFIFALGSLSYIRLRPSWRELGLLIPLVGYSAFLMLQNINIGWRHFLPAYVFMLMAASRCAAGGVTGRLVPFITIAIVGIITPLRWHPDYLAYINWPRKEIHLDISDSNLDWGQALKQTADWIDRHQAFINHRPVYLRAVGVSNRGVSHYLGGRVIQLHYGDMPPRSGILILSPVSLSGISESNDRYAYLRHTLPREIIGHTLRVYDLDNR